MKSYSLLKYIVIGGLFLIPILPFIVAKSMLFPFITGKAFAFRIIVELIFVFWAVLALRDEKYRPRKSLLLWVVTIFVVIIGLADLFGEYSFKSFWSNFERMEGFVTILHLYLYFVVLSSIFTAESIWRKYFAVWVGVGLAMSIFSILQLAGKFTINQGGVRVDGTFGNATYLAIFLVFTIFLAILLSVRKKIKGLWLYAPLIMLFLAVLYYTATRGAILGLIGGVFITAILIAITAKGNKMMRRGAIVVVSIIIALLAVFLLVKDSAFVKESPVLSRFSSISGAELKNQGRYFVWPMAIKGFKENPILGWGQENFNYVFNKNYDPRMYNQEQWFDRAHDIVLDWLTAGGLLGLLSYLSIFFAVLWMLWKKSSLLASEKGIITGLLAAYFFHNIFVFDNLISYILFFAILGFVQSTSVKEPISVPKLLTNPKASNVIGSILIIALGFSIYFINIKPIKASQTLIGTLNEIRANGGSQQSINLFNKAFSYKTFGNPEILEQAGSAADAFLADEVSDEIKQNYVKMTDEQFKIQVAKTPRDARYWMLYGMFLARTGRIDESLNAYGKAEELSPNKQSVLVEAGAVHLANSSYKEALEYFKKAFELDESYQSVRIIYGVGALYAGENSLAQEILAPVPPEVLLNDDRLIGVYMDRGDYTTIVKIFESRIQLSPDNPQNYLSLAALYLQIGQRTQSVQVLEGFTQKYPQYKAQVQAYIDQINAGETP